MTTGVTCPACATGVSPGKDQPCRDCEIDAMHGPGRPVARLMQRLFTGSARQEPEQGSVRFVKDKEIGQ